MNEKTEISKYARPSITPISKSRFAPKPAQKAIGLNGQARTDDVGMVHQSENTGLPQSHLAGYAVGFSHALQLVEHLLARGITTDVILTQLHEMLENDIRPLAKVG